MSNANKTHHPGDGSSGPKSSAGKERCSRNATTHGARSETHVILPTEDPADYEKVLCHWTEEFPGGSDLDTGMIKRVAQLQWHSKRCDRLYDEAFLRALTDESDPFNWPDDVKKHIALMERYRTAADRAWRAAWKDLVTLRKNRLDDLLLKEKLRRLRYQNYCDGLIKLDPPKPKQSDVDPKPTDDEDPTDRSGRAAQPGGQQSPAKRLS